MLKNADSHAPLTARSSPGLTPTGADRLSRAGTSPTALHRFALDCTESDEELNLIGYIDGPRVVLDLSTGLLARVVFHATSEECLAKLEELAQVITCTLRVAGPLLTLTGLRRMRESLMQGCASQSGNPPPRESQRYLGAQSSSQFH